MNKKILKNVWIVICAFITILSIFGLNEITSISPEMIDIANEHNLAKVFAMKLTRYFQNSYGVVPFFLFGIITYFYSCVHRKTNINKLKIISIILGMLFSITIIVGRSLMDTEGLLYITYDKFQIFVSIIKFWGFSSLFFNSFYMLFVTIDENKEAIVISSKDVSIKVINSFDKHPVFYTAIFLFLLYIPYIIIYYPGLMNLDSLFEINQFFREIEWNSHHPIMATIIYGLFMKLAMFLGNTNLGIFLPNILQMILGILLISHIIDYFYKQTCNRVVRVLTILFFGVIPIWPIDLYTEVKDVPFSMATLGIVFTFIKAILSKNKFSKKDYFLYSICLFVLLFFRHNGMHTLIFCLPFLIWAFYNDKELELIGKKLTTIMVIVLIFTNILNHFLMSTLNISLGSKKEMMPILLQQTSRYIAYYEEELTEHEIEVIDKIIDVKEVKNNYDPQTVDYVKETFREPEPSKAELRDYFKVWFEMFLKHPTCYILATLTSTFGYVDPEYKELKDGIALYKFGYEESIDKINSKVHQNLEYASQRDGIEKIAYATRNTPIGIIYSCGLYFWILLVITIILIYYKRAKCILPLVPLYAIELITFLSPVNAFVRYMMPIMICAPFIIIYMMICIGKNIDELE